MGRYLEFFDECYYINRAERQDRSEAFIKRAFEVGILPKRQEAVKPEFEYVKYLYEGHEDITRAEKISCTLSHQSIIQEAKNNNYDCILIFEDDCLFLDNFKEKLSKSIFDLKNFEWDIFYLGGEPNNYLHQISDSLYTMKERGGIYCLHAYAIHKRFYDKILSIEANKISILDNYILNMSSEERKLFAPSEILAIQDYTFSDIWHYMTNSQDLMINGWNKYIKNEINSN